MDNDLHAAQLELSRQHAARIERLDEIIKELDDGFKDMNWKLDALLQKQAAHEAALDTLNTIVHGALFLRWILLGLLGGLAAIKTLTEAYHYFVR